MRVWHICDVEVSEIFKKQGYLNCGNLDNKLFNDDRVEGGIDYTIKNCYDYMANKLLKKCPNKPKQALDYPVWVWYKYSNDSNIYEAPLIEEYDEYEKHQVRITLEISEELVLLSDYDLWHIPLNNGFVCNNKADFDYLTHVLTSDILANKYPMTLGRLRELNWELIFQLDRFLCPEWNGEYVNYPNYFGRSIQGVTWVLYWDWVIDIKKIEKKEKEKSIEV